MTSLSDYNDITKNEFQSLFVNGFYGPGGWAAWCITLIASWVPILRDDYTHNLHYITYSLYLNWAAINYFQLLHIEQRFGELATDVKNSLRQIANAEIPLARIVEDPKDGLGLCSISKAVIGKEEFIALTATSRFGPWRWSVSELGERNFGHLRADERKNEFKPLLTAHKKTCRQLVSRWVQSRAAAAVLNLGSLHACAQLVVTIRKNIKATESVFARKLWKRNLIISLGQILPLIAMWFDFLAHRQDMPSRWIRDMLPNMGTVFATAIGVLLGGLWLSNIANLDSDFRSMYAPLFNILVVSAVFARCFGALMFVLFVEKGVSRRCLFVPCTPVRISELDQAFALFVALVYFLYEIRAVFLKLFMCLGFYLKRLFFRDAHLTLTTQTRCPLDHPHLDLEQSQIDSV